MLQLYLTPGRRSASKAIRAVGPGLRGWGMEMSNSRGWQDSSYVVITPLGLAGSCHENVRLFVDTAVIWNARGREEAVEKERSTYQFHIVARNNTEHCMVTLALFYLLCPSHAICPMFWSCHWGTTDFFLEVCQTFCCYLLNRMQRVLPICYNMYMW